MAHLIMNNPNIRGLDVRGTKQILAQFADDTSAYLKFEKLTLDTFTKTLQRIEYNTGLKVSYDKTTIYRVGLLYAMNARLIMQQTYKWSNEPIQTLGVTIPCDGSESDNNFSEVLEKVKRVANNWINRQATLFGKVLLVNSLIGSLLVYKMLTMLDLKDTQIREINGIIRSFLWNNKRAKISLEMLQKGKDQGGLRLVNIKAKQEALKITWIVKLWDDEFLANCAYNELDLMLKESIWKCNIKEDDVSMLFNVQSFWGQMLKAWSKINYKDPQNCTEVLHEVLWLNSNIHVENTPIIWHHWVRKGIWYVKDIISTDGSVNRDLEVNWLELQTLWHAIPIVWKCWLQDEYDGSCSENGARNMYDAICDSKKPFQKSI